MVVMSIIAVFMWNILVCAETSTEISKRRFEARRFEARRFNAEIRGTEIQVLWISVRVSTSCFFVAESLRIFLPRVSATDDLTNKFIDQILLFFIFESLRTWFASNRCILPTLRPNRCDLPPFSRNAAICRPSHKKWGSMPWHCDLSVWLPTCPSAYLYSIL